MVGCVESSNVWAEGGGGECGGGLWLGGRMGDGRRCGDCPMPLHLALVALVCGSCKEGVLVVRCVLWSGAEAGDGCAASTASNVVVECAAGELEAAGHW